SPKLQSVPALTETVWEGAHAGKGRVTWHIAATSPRSTLQSLSQLGFPLPFRSPTMGGAKDVLQSDLGPWPAGSMLAQPGGQSEGSGLLRNTSKKLPVEHMLSPTTWLLWPKLARLPRIVPQRLILFGRAQLTPKLHPGASRLKFLSEARRWAR